MRFDEACEKAFNRTESFPPRYGWAKKAFDSCASNPDLYKSNEGIEELVLDLGVGKSMVKSLRHWGQAFRIFSPVKRSYYPTPIGETFFTDDGWDPYCEYADTSWLLHWWLLAPKSFAPVWWLTFNEFTGIEFTAEELEQFVIDRSQKWEPAANGIKKDVNALIRMYSSGATARATFEDLVDCPFRELDLLRPSQRESGMFRFLIGEKATLSSAVVAFSCIDFFARSASKGKTITIAKLATEAGSPGRAFKLPEPALLEQLEETCRANSKLLKLTSAAGVPQLVLEKDPREVATKILFEHYKNFSENIHEPKYLLVGEEADTAIVPELVS